MGAKCGHLLRKGHKLQGFENKLPRKILDPTKMK
jgi:hypothetical protein